MKKVYIFVFEIQIMFAAWLISRLIYTMHQPAITCPVASINKVADV